MDMDNSTNRRRVRTLPSWLSDSISTSGIESQTQRKSSDDSSKVTIENSLPVTVSVKTEFTECEDDLFSCSSTYIEPDVKPKVEEIPVETVFVQEIDIREEETVAAVETADSTNMNDSFHSDTDEAITFDSAMKCKIESTTPTESSTSAASSLFAVPTSTVSSPIPTSTNISNPSGRPICIFRHKCYRKNPQHRKDFSHSGDADYDDQSECDSTSADSASTKPRCWYGRNCYRKNEEHKRKFHHSPNSRKRNATRVQRENVNEDDGSDTYDDSFIDDDSADEFSLGSDNEETGFSDFENYSSSDNDDICQGLGRSKKKKFSIL